MQGHLWLPECVRVKWETDPLDTEGKHALSDRQKTSLYIICI